jgi:hypothetical protein
MVNIQNAFEFGPIEYENYTCVSSQTLELEFPRTGLPDVVRERPAAPLRQRSRKEIAKLQKHPFFQELNQE